MCVCVRLCVQIGARSVVPAMFMDCTGKHSNPRNHHVCAQISVVSKRRLRATTADPMNSVKCSSFSNKY